MTLYDTLNVKNSATPEEIKKAYHKSAKKNHPDKKGDPEKMQSINKAYAVLKDPARRERYDKHGDESTVNNDESIFTSIVCEIISSLIDRDPVNVQQAIKNLAQEWDRNYNSGKTKCQKELERLNNFKNRIIKNPENNLVGGFIDGKINALNLQILTIENDYIIRKKAIMYLVDQYDYIEKKNDNNDGWVNIGSIKFVSTSSGL